MKYFDLVGRVKTYEELCEYLEDLEEEYRKADLISLGIIDNLLWMWKDYGFKIIIPLLERLKLGREKLVDEVDVFCHGNLRDKIEKLFKIEALYQIGGIIFTRVKDSENTFIMNWVGKLIRYLPKPNDAIVIFDQTMDSIEIFRPPLAKDSKDFFPYLLNLKEEEFNIVLERFIVLLETLIERYEAKFEEIYLKKADGGRNHIFPCKRLLSVLLNIFKPEKIGKKVTKKLVKK